MSRGGEANGPVLDGMEYRVVRALGNGAGSTIFLISETIGGKKYALKVVKRESPEDDVYIAQARHEFDVANRLQHPSVLRIYDCRVKKAWFKPVGVELLMEYVDGRTLDDLDTRDLNQLLLMFIHVASALNHMHHRGVFHGDLKPGNLMLSRAGLVKVIDFGTAWIKGEPKNRVQGTPQYMAPEQSTDRLVDEKTDIYNFGATMYRMFTGEYANLCVPGFQGAELGQRARPQAPIRLVEGFPGTLNETIMACLETNPDRRPAGVFEIKRQLVAVARHLGLKPDDLSGSEGDDDPSSLVLPAKEGPRGSDTGFWNIVKAAPEMSGEGSKTHSPERWKCPKCRHVWYPQSGEKPTQCPKCQFDRVAKT